jgi:hypothetical protein
LKIDLHCNIGRPVFILVTAEPYSRRSTIA